MRALSIRQPWAWLIVHGHKDVENRSWSTNYRGQFYVHASKKLDNTEWERNLMRDRMRRLGVQVPDDECLPVGGIVGVGTIVDVLDCSRSSWFTGPYGLLIRHARPVPFREYKGRLGFFDVK